MARKKTPDKTQSSETKKVVRITDLKDLPKGAKQVKTRNTVSINDDPKGMKIPANNPEVKRYLNTMTPQDLKRFSELFGTLYIEE
jgi:hypothetical protein